MARRVWIGAAIAAITLAGCGAETSSANVAAAQETTTTAIGPPSTNASLPLAVTFDIGAEQENAPPDWTAGIPNERFENMQLSFIDPTAAERYEAWAPVVDDVLDVLFVAVAAGEIPHDFSAGIDRWGAPVFTADSDETEAFIRGLFPPDIAEDLEIKRGSARVLPEPFP